MVEEGHLNESIEVKAQQEKRSEEICSAMNHLLSINYLSIGTVLTVEALVIINIATHNIIPIWIIFSTLWLGHAILAIIVFYSVKQIFASLESDKATPIRSDSDPQSTQRWHISNEKTIPLIQYLIYCLLRLLWVSSNLLLAEILGYLTYLSLVPKFSSVIPIYILAGCSIISAVICR